MYETEVTKAQTMLVRYTQPPELLDPSQARELLKFTDTVCCVLLVAAREDMRGKYSDPLEQTQRKDVFVRVSVMAEMAMWTAGQVGFMPTRRIWRSPTSTVQIVAACSQTQHIVSSIAGSLSIDPPAASAVALTLAVLEAFVGTGPVFARMQYSPDQDEYYNSNPPRLDEIDRLLWSNID